MARVVSWVPSGKPANQNNGADESKTNVGTCRIDCPKCGTNVLHQHYPASSVLRACPSPQSAEPAPHGVLVESHDLSPLGLPVFRRSPLPSMPTPLPRRNRPMLSLSCRAATAFPLTQEGRLPPQVIFRGLLGVHSRFGLPVRSITQGDFCQSTSTHVVTSLRRSDCFRPSDRLAGRDSHPLEIADFHGVLDC
jgi:hypothetical protein